MKEWRPCCPYREGFVVELDGVLWQAMRRTGAGEKPGESGAWQYIRAVDAASMVDPRIGEGL